MHWFKPQPNSLLMIYSLNTAHLLNRKAAEQVPEVQPLDFNFSFEQKESAETKSVAEPVETKNNSNHLNSHSI